LVSAGVSVQLSIGAECFVAGKTLFAMATAVCLVPPTYRIALSEVLNR